MNKAADLAQEVREGRTVIRLSGNLSIACLNDLPDRLDAVEGPVDTIDLSDVDYMDTIGAWVLHRTIKRLGARIESDKCDAERLIAAVGRVDEPVNIRPDYIPPWQRVVGQIGEAVVNSGTTLLGLLGFFGGTLVATWNVIRHPGRFRINAVVQRFEVVGVSALGIIGLMSFLIGIVIAQQGSVQLRQFGMEMLTINLVGRLTFRELGVLMTAIMVAGRSGSAFAAQLGTMKLTEEVDAMRTIGVSPMEALVLPRTLAVVVMMPLLSFYASIVAIIGGGFLCAVSLDIPPITFVQRLREVVPIHDLWVGLIKAPVFGVIIALAGCFQGMQVKANAEEVGLRTTSAVVQAIFLVIVLDAFFAVFFTWVGWN
ncbi:MULTISPECIES: MlaE family lipid ABC transporter permease subunit [Sphingobium]|uniref:ABC transporter permease n=1 Tax=Sphingobium chungbukense TaxID=56193 RepID=A0A0M3AWB8_9SPHN|nr:MULTISPECIES: MlaE family lipid ABC transporter permease subunit [Sphingobium]KKW94150.1 ABC transporter permease [Sphingobium chungbukense]PJG49736.1 ABC transporter permease [Sphingobium sp. LB126]